MSLYRGGGGGGGRGSWSEGERVEKKGRERGRRP